jgi:hypothetical protein
LKNGIVLLALALAVSLGACASNQPQTVASADGEPKMKRKCSYEKSTGSRLGNRVCKNVEVTE